MRLENKIAVITGASRGIGLAMPEGFLPEGPKVVLASRKQEALDEAAAALREKTGGTVLPIAAHTGYEENCHQLIEKTSEAFGRVDIMVNNAATNPHFGSLLQAETSQWQKTFEVNVLGYFWMSKYAALSMQKSGGGKIINMASVAGLEPSFMMGVYSCTKAAVIMQTRTFARELASDHIQVNAIAPGFIKTRFSQALWANEELNQQIEERTPAGYMAEPESLVGGAVYLASPESDFLTGHVLTIDGGLTISTF